MAMMDPHMTSMHEMHERVMSARSADERHAMRAEHLKMMRDGMAMMGEMGAAGETKGMKGMHGSGHDACRHGTAPTDDEEAHGNDAAHDANDGGPDAAGFGQAIDRSLLDYAEHIAPPA